MKIIFSAVRLTEDSRMKLMSLVDPLYETTYYDHMTLLFGKQETPANLGELVDVEIVGIGSDEKAQAAVVGNLSRFDDKIPHITLSCRDGVNPAWCNEMLQSGWEKIKPISLQGLVSIYTIKGSSKGWVGQ